MVWGFWGLWLGPGDTEKSDPAPLVASLGEERQPLVSDCCGDVGPRRAESSQLGAGLSPETLPR